MEDLSEYNKLIKASTTSIEYKDNILKQILKLFNTMWDRGMINYDFTNYTPNPMVKDEELKMVDLEFIKLEID